ncbi:pyruvate formate lyase-activating protein [Collinsella sp. AGMB00827]|uniref:Pyruvate formate-lyase-activating enzyme n=1 Tax=Collinsella ureilytica TaxID=2869515 RepID=A0ABS7MJT8_9ACTN|nr:pyruvate formate-lyase-activating protein [Collinsella urealyticum]MBY4797303.1 pyruvate formate lyase-activating protein [Collinsella urealyticum]
MAQVVFTEDPRARESAYTLGRIHSIETMGTVDGPGIRFVVFTQGCPMRCAYCHNPDTWDVRAGAQVSVEHLIDLYESNRAFYKTGGITVSGGEPLLQPAFLADLFRAMHARPRGRVHTCLDSCGYAFDPAHPERFDAVLAETDLVLLDIKHSNPEGHRKLTGQSNERILAFGAHLAARGIKTVIRHVVVPGITDSVEECEALGRLIGPWLNVVGLEMLPYHTMGIPKYKQMGLEYPLAGVPPMDKERMPELRQAVLRGMKESRSKAGSHHPKSH